ncbi:putative bacterial alpha-L-rhamnosidase C-terminal domain-containing protein [Elsinoe australis]|uniref:Putative bacterial alpha-L-rhamnosidase C-terminal domain-containing protein n=1 Tax=Elsinoe australis TaxID=40998 RepID=A0A4U7AQS5_9PEZI|nr:putative bacterial alpha-L-rhamnosidase C-terminal domain-containing protein [Elsinoe australis]
MKISPYSHQSKTDSIKKIAQARAAFIDPYSGLMAASPEVPVASYFLGPANGSAVSALSAYAYGLLVPLAEAVGDIETARLYTDTANKLRDAINEHLWNPSEGVYGLSTDAPSNYSYTSIALTILSDTANSTQAASMIARLSDLRCGEGYKTQSSDDCNEQTQLAPNPSGFLLESLFKAYRDHGTNVTVAQVLLDDFCSKMVTNDTFTSGASWEYLFPDGSPGIGDFTSLAQPWSGASTYILPEYILGITPFTPGFRTWKFAPLVDALRLTNASGTVVSPFGDIDASRQIEGEEIVVTVVVPNGTEGILVISDDVEEGHPLQHTKLTGGKTHRINIAKKS